MNDMPLVSIIVPIYNTEKELVKCLESVVSQTYTNIEVICVDDGSTDLSGEILDEFAKEEERVIAIHQNNNGESNARNVALKMCKGKYVGFLDCDDWIDEDMYMTLVTEAEDNECDLVAASWYSENGENTKAITNKLNAPEGVMTKDELLYCIYRRDDFRGFAYMWNKLYKRSILIEKEKQLLFDEAISLGGDVIFLAKAALNVERAKYIDSPFYHYRQRDKSGCHTNDIVKLKDWIKSYDIILNLFEEENVSKETINYVKRFMAYHSSNFAEIAEKKGDIAAKIYFQNYMKKYMNEYIGLNLDYKERIDRFMKIMHL